MLRPYHGVRRNKQHADAVDYTSMRCLLQMFQDRGEWFFWRKQHGASKF